MKRPPIPPTLVVFGLAFFAVAGLLVVRAQTRPGAPAHPASDAAPTLRVEAVAVQAQPVQGENRLSGQVEPYHVAVVAAEAADRIMARPVRQGDRVEKGALLATLFSDTAAAALAQTQAALDQATAERRQAETDYERALVETDAARRQAQAQVALALADRQRAQALTLQAEAGERKTQTYTRRQELRQAEDALTQARTDERLAKIELDRAVTLVRQGAEAQQVLDRAQATYDAAVARRRSAEQGLSLSQEGARPEDREAASAQAAAARAQIDVAARQVDQARAGLRIADTRDTRLAVLRRQIDGLRAREAQAREAVQLARITLTKHTILAPFAGRVLATPVDVGDLTSPGTPLIRLGEVDRVKVTCSVPEASRPLLHLGQSIEVAADALPGRTFAGRISALGFQADAASRAFPIEVTVDNPKEALLPNMIARLRLPLGAPARRLLIPADAVATDGESSYVYLLQEGRTRRRTVLLGAPVGNRVEVLSGLNAGDRIAATPQRLTDGAAIDALGDRP